MANSTIYPYGTGGDLPASIGLVNDFVTGGVDKALTAEAGKTLYEKLYGEPTVVYTKADADVYRVLLTGAESTSGIRLRVVLPVLSGQYVKASCSQGKGVAASVYSTVEECKGAGTDYLETLSYSYVESVEGTIGHDGYLCVSLCKSDESAFSDADQTAYINALQLTVYSSGEGDIVRLENLIENISIDDAKVSNVFIGTVVQKSMTASGLSDTNASYRVSMASNIVIPREGVKLTFHLPAGYGVGVRSGNESGNLSNNNYWYFDGNSLTLSTSSHYMRMCFARATSVSDSATTTTISAQDVAEKIASGEIAVTMDYEEGIVERNKETEKYVKSVMRNFVSGASNNGSLNKLPIFAHTSDVHGDATRFKSFADYCDFLKVDAALISGDTTATSPSDGMQYINDIADEHSSMFLLCMGNHDSRNLASVQAQNEQIVGYLMTKNSVTTNPNETYPTYFYKDFSSKNIRVIALNLYEGAHSSSNIDKCIFTQTQCEWFISALASTPANYGVLVMFHSPEGRPSKDSDHAAFYQEILNWTGYHSGLTGDVFRTIIDAFIGKTSASITYTSAGSSITVSADFTSVNSGVEFIAYVNGHLHTDEIGYISGATHMQLNLNVCCGVAVYGSSYAYLANNSDMPRSCTGATQDCFNIYAIDRSAKTVRVAKVGSNVSGYDLSERKYMVIPYAD